MTAAGHQPEETGASAGDGSASTTSADSTPYFEVTRGNPTPTEVGILAAVFATAQGNGMYADGGDTGMRNDWGALEDRLRPPFGYNPSSFLNRRLF